MIPIIKKVHKSLLDLRLLLVHPRRGLITLYEESTNNLTSSYSFLEKISLEQLNNLSDGNLPEIKFLSFLGGGVVQPIIYCY